MSPRRSDRKSTRLNSSHTEIYTLSLHDALPIWSAMSRASSARSRTTQSCRPLRTVVAVYSADVATPIRSEEHTSELQSHRDLHSFPTRRSSDLVSDEPRFVSQVQNNPVVQTTAHGGGGVQR